MKNRFAATMAALILFATQADGEELTIDRMVASPSLSGPSIAGLKLAPDGSRVTFLKGKDADFRQQDLWEYNVSDGATRMLVDSVNLVPDEELDEVEKARRERQRIYASGIVEYYWSPKADALLFPLGGDLFYLPLGGKVRRLTATDTFETDIRFSPGGGYVSFIRDADLYVIELASGEERRLTTGGGGVISNGVAEFVAQEEMDRDTGYWWAPDESKIAFTRIDESPVRLVDRYELGDAGVTTIAQRYPFAGTDNVTIKLGIVPITGGAPAWIDLGPEEDIYLARVQWLPDSETVAFQRQSRDQKKLELVFADSAAGKGRVVLAETAETWTNILGTAHFLKGKKRFVWLSERDGYAHLYLMDFKGRVRKRLTAGQWAVSGLKGVDEDGGRVYFQANADGPLERHLYAVSLAGAPEEMTRLTRDPGWHTTSLSADLSVFTDKFSADGVPPKVALNRIDGERIAWLEENPLDQDHPYAPYLPGHVAKAFGTLNAEDGTVLHYSLMRPKGLAEGERWPAIVFVYGGPLAQTVRNQWAGDRGGFPQILARNGYVVFTLDNRGMANRGKAFEDPVYRNMGHVEVTDQVAGVAHLKSLPFVDPERIGIYGWSYGGYMTLMALMRAPEAFDAGVSIAPVTNWRLYDTHYTERYMGHPADPGGAYERSSVFPYVENLSAPLLLMHGMADDNVFFDHTVTLISALQDRRVPFELMTYPGKRHRIAGEDTRAHLWRTVLAFFDRHLGGGAD